MSILDGLAATRKIRRLKDGKDIPIIALSGNVMRGFKEECFEAGMSGFLSKPYDPKEIETCLRLWSEPQESVALSR